VLFRSVDERQNHLHGQTIARLIRQQQQQQH